MLPVQPKFDINELSALPLFRYTDTKELILKYPPRTAIFGRGEEMLAQGEVTRSFGILLDGTAAAYRTGADGSRVLLQTLSSGSVFGDVLSVSENIPSPVSVRACDSCRAVFIDRDAVFSDLGFMRAFAAQFAEKYFALHDRINCLVCRNLREKIIACLTVFSGEKGRAFNLPFDRAGFAEYVNADRSALSRELSRMKDEGLIDYYRNSFRIL